MLTLCPTNNCNLSFRVHQPISRPRFESLTERDFFDELIYLCPPPTHSSPRRERRILATHEFTRLPPPLYKARIQIFRWQYSRRLPANVEFQLANSILSVTFKKYVSNVQLFNQILVNNRFSNRCMLKQISILDFLLLGPT